MGKVDCLSIDKCECFFNSSDHRPSHFHVKNVQDKWEIRVYIETTTKDELHFDFKFPKSGKEINSKIQREIRTKVVDNRKDLIEEWSNKVCEE